MVYARTDFEYKSTTHERVCAALMRDENGSGPGIMGRRVGNSG